MNYHLRRRYHLLRSSIQLSDPENVRRWCLRFNCTEQQLREAVQVAGSLAFAVKKHLNVERPIYRSR